MTRALARRRRRERLAGALVVVLGITVLVVAIIALRNPKPDSTVAGTQTGTTSLTRSAATTSSASRSSSRSVSTSPTRSGTRPSSAASTSRPTSPSASTSRNPVIGSVPLIVLNQSGTSGQAATAQQQFTAAGWQVTSTDDNYLNDVVTTTAYYDPAVVGSQAAAQELQRQFPTIKRVAERFSNLTPGPLVVVLTADYSPN